MKVFNHTDPSILTPEQLAISWYRELHTLSDKGIHHNTKFRAAYIFGSTYRPLSSWGKVLKLYLEILEYQQPGILAALLSNGMLSIYAADGSIKSKLVATEHEKESLKQPSSIGNTGYYYDTLTQSKESLDILRRAVKLTNTENKVLIYTLRHDIV